MSTVTYDVENTASLRAEIVRLLGEIAKLQTALDQVQTIAKTAIDEETK